MLSDTDTQHDLARTGEPVLRVENLVQEFHIRDATHADAVLHAVSGVSFEVRPGEALGIVGETGCGKSTLARSIMQAPSAKEGSVQFNGRELRGLRGGDLRLARRQMQMIFQDPFSSLDPTWQVEDIVAEPLVGYGIGSKNYRHERTMQSLELVGLTPSQFAKRRPKSLSGGQAQRVAVARALVVSPRLLICDEPVSSLDVLIQAQILNLFDDLRRELDVAYLFISHDLATVQYVCDRVVVMYLGRFCELGPAAALYEEPFHPYTAALLASRPENQGARVAAPALVSTEIPSALDPPSGCRFRTRCPRATERCITETPLMLEVAPGRQVACHHPLSIDAPVDDGSGSVASRSEPEA